MATKTKTQPIIIISYRPFKNNYMLGFFFGRHFHCGCIVEFLYTDIV